MTQVIIKLYKKDHTGKVAEFQAISKSFHKGDDQFKYQRVFGCVNKSDHLILPEVHFFVLTPKGYTWNYESQF